MTATESIDLMEDYRSRGRTVYTPGRGVFVIDQGDGPPVLFLHGIPTYSYLWRDVTPTVSSERRTVAVDLPGFGLSEKRSDWDYSVATQADALRSLMLQLEIERPAIVCHDFGALVAAELVAREPGICSHLILLNTSLRSRAWSGGISPLTFLRVPLVGELAMALSRSWMLKAAMNVYVSERERLTLDVMDHYWWPFMHGFKGTLLNMSRHRAAESGDFDRWRTALAHLTVPCLIVWGAEDPTFTLHEARDLERLVPTAHLNLFEHANHFLPEDRPHALGRVINGFLNEVL